MALVVKHVSNGSRPSLLVRWPDKHLIDRDVAATRNDIANCVGDVVCLERLVHLEPRTHRFENFGAIVTLQFRRDVSRFDERDAHVTARNFLAERFAEGADGEL